MKSLLIAIVAGEPSGDVLGANLMRSLKKIHPSISFIGVGGPLMEKEGMKSLFPMDRLSLIGIIEVCSRIFELLVLRKNLIRTLIDNKPDTFIGIDSPDFNLTIELRLKQSGIKTVHYVSPSVWAWRKKRTSKIRKCCDLLLVLFPFEVKIYEELGIPVRYIGHVLADLIPLDVKKSQTRSELKIPAFPLVSLMPGSREGEVNTLGKLFLDVAERINKSRPDIRFAMIYSNSLRQIQMNKLLEKRNLPLELFHCKDNRVLIASDVALVASGTATLEALLCKCPMVVAYRLNKLTYYILKRLVKVPYISLPNLISGHMLVPEFLQDAANSKNLSSSILKILENNIEQVKSFNKIHCDLRCKASKKAASAILELSRGKVREH